MRKAFIFIILFIGLIFLGEFIFEKVYPYPKKIEYAVSFSPKYATSLGLDWQKNYLQMMDELNVRKIRIPTYWDLLEKTPNQYDFSEVDFMVKEAEKRQVQLLMVVGVRQPRWPECHVPEWAKELSLADRQKKILEFVKTIVERYKDYQSVWAFQVENEFFLPLFGQGCDKAEASFLKKEIDLVRSLSNKKILISDSGEFGLWITSMQLSDIFGTTLYRKTYDPILGYKTYPVLPYFYALRSQITRKFFASKNEKTVIIELQAEPWLSNNKIDETNIAKQLDILPIKDLKDYVEYAKKTGFDEVYFWGVEWWYFMAAHGYPEYLEYVGTLFK